MCDLLEHIENILHDWKLFHSENLLIRQKILKLFYMNLIETFERLACFSQAWFIP